MFFLALALAPLAVLVYKFIIYPNFLSPLRHLPGPPLGHPILGQLPTLHGPDAGFIQKSWFKKYGPIVRIQAPIGTEMILLEDPKDIVACLENQKGMQKASSALYRHIAAFVAGDGLLSFEGDAHDRLRKILNPAFSLTNLTKQMAFYPEIINNFTTALDDALKTSDTLPMCDYLAKAALDILCKGTFNYDSGALKNESKAMVKAYSKLAPLQNARTYAALTIIDMIPHGLDFVLSKWFLSSFSSLLSKVEPLEFLSIATRSMTIIRQSSLEILEENMSSDNHGPKRDVMSTILRAHKDGKGRDKLKTSELPDQVLTFLTGGHETVTAALSWILWFIAKHPECQNRLRREIHAVSGGDVIEDYTRVRDLPYLDAVINESMRLLPSSPILRRQAMEPTEVRGVTLPTGTMVYLFIRNANSFEEVWGPDADKFNPERWENLPAGLSAAQAKLSFGRGYRTCIGRNMALQEMKALAASLVNSYELSPAHEDQAIHAEYLITYKPADGLPLRLRKLGEPR
ncbi:cytochrome P450 [Cylindrobasidium torrendii FP15055 ss-10]|uniref:Cytochrome P450 n=1 Tax=Cylindrobasidium torrendii FP15055 ss-10 TaxID=1314674 RepID=A0A0D7B876_9AGAR|nr:cytochrome P450 [Cylindrobasidium torrendii FP15055 ss-10]